MADVNVFALLVAVVAAFIASGAWYAALGSQLAELNPAYAEAGPSAGATAAVELVRNLVLSVVIVGLVIQLDSTGLGQGLALGGALWLGFPVVLLVGSVFHERVPARLAAIHAGDWLVKLLLIAGLLAAWR